MTRCHFAQSYERVPLFGCSLAFQGELAPSGCRSQRRCHVWRHSICNLGEPPSCCHPISLSRSTRGCFPLGAGSCRPGQLEAWGLDRSRGLAGPVTLGGFAGVPALVGLGFPDRFPVVGLDILTGFRGVRAGVGGEFLGGGVEEGGEGPGGEGTSAEHGMDHIAAAPCQADDCGVGSSFGALSL